MSTQKTITFSDSQYKSLQTGWKEYNNTHNPELNFSQFIGAKLGNTGN